MQNYVQTVYLQTPGRENPLTPTVVI